MASDGYHLFSFYCSDLGHKCPWSISGSDEERMLAEIKQHGQAEHSAISISEEDEQKIRRAIRKQAA